MKIALIGYGYWGPNIARTLFRLDTVTVGAICDIDKSKLAGAARIYKDAKLTNSPDDVFNDSSIEAVILATPPKSHFALASKVLRSNKHVLVEKPLTTSSSDAKELEKISKRLKKVIMVGHTFEYNSVVRAVRSIINEGKIGEVRYIYGSRLNLGQIRGDINVVWNLAPHDISILNYLLQKKPQKVRAVGTSFLQKNIEDVAFITLMYPGNIMANIHLSWIDPSKERKMTVVGSKKMVVYDDMDNEQPLKIYDKRADTGEIAKGLSTEYKIKLHSGDIYSPQVQHTEPLYEELAHFIDCCRKNTVPLTDVKSGIAIVKTIEACQRSLKNNGLWEKIK